MVLTENELNTLRLLKTKTSNSPLSDPLFRATDKYIRSTILDESGKSDKEVKELIIKAYHNYTSDPTSIPMIVHSIIDNPMLQLGKTYDLISDIQLNESDLGKNTSMGVLHLTKRLINHFKPTIVKVDVFLIDLMRQVYGDKPILNTISLLKQSGSE